MFIQGKLNLKRLTKLFLLAFSALLVGVMATGCKLPETSDPELISDDSVAPVFTYSIVDTYPHDPNAFTQGLVYEDGVFYEGTGLYGRSSLHRVEPQSGEVMDSLDLPDSYFGEGITILGKKIYQLTWKEHTCFVYEKQNFDLITSFAYSTEGWGLTTDGHSLIMSDGTSSLYFFDPDTFNIIRQIDVLDDGKPVTNINELEYVKGEIFANIWQTDIIAMVDPDTGWINGWVSLTGLLESTGDHRDADVLNGIAYDAENDRLFVTGKRWPDLFEIRLLPSTDSKQ